MKCAAFSVSGTYFCVEKFVYVCYMAKLNIKAKVDVTNGNIETGLSLISFIEDGVTIIYSPALDLSGSGYDLNEAKASFWEALSEFFRYTVNKKTLLPELKKMGWTVKGGTNGKKIKAPDNTALLRSNKEFEDIFNNKEFRTFNETVQIPAFA
jgi:hypothetical protein